MDNTIDHTFESANRVYDKNNLCPTIPTCAGGGIQPKIIEETKCVGGLSDGKWGNQYHQQDRVYKGDIALAQPANLPEGSYKYVMEEIKIRQATKEGTISERQNSIKIKRLPNGNIRFYRDDEKKSAVSELQVQSGADVAQTITVANVTKIYKEDQVEIKQATKEGSIKCKVGGCYDASYPDSKTRRGRVQEGGDITPTITAQGGENINYIEEIINEEEKGIREVLYFLRSEIGEKSFSEWTIRGLYCFLKKEILQQKLYAEIVLENWKESAELEQFTYDSKGNKSIITSEEELRDMWKDWETRCTPYRRKLSEQQNRKLNDFMQKLSHKDTQAEEIVFYLWETCKGIGILRKTLSKIQEIWESFNDKQRSRTSYRIRKLTPREVWRLMGYTDEDFEKAVSQVSNTQLYKEAGNAIVKQVLMAIFSQMNIKGVKPWNDMTLEEKYKLIQKSTSGKK